MAKKTATKKAASAKRAGGKLQDGIEQLPWPHEGAPGLTPVELAALNIAGKWADKQRAGLQIGAGQVVDVTVRLTGSIEVKGPNVYDDLKSPPAGELVGVMLSLLSSRVRTALIADVEAFYKKLAGDKVKLSLDDKAFAEELVARLAVKTTITQKGAVLGNVRAELVSRG